MARNYVALPAAVAARAVSSVSCVGCGTSVIPSPSARPYEGDGLMALDHHPLRVGLEAAYCPDPGAGNETPDCPVVYCGKFCLIAGDAGGAIYIDLYNVACKEGVSEDDPSTWDRLNLNGFKYFTMYLRDLQTKEHWVSIHGYPIMPLVNGRCVFLFQPGKLDCVSGEYEAEVEVEYHNGRIVTAIEKILFEIREDFSGHGENNTHPKCHGDGVEHWIPSDGPCCGREPIDYEQFPNDGSGLIPEKLTARRKLLVAGLHTSFRDIVRGVDS